jgi:hypothetical protein
MILWMEAAAVADTRKIGLLRIRFGAWAALAVAAAAVSGGSCGALVGSTDNGPGLGWENDSAAPLVVVLVVAIQGFVALIGVVNARSGKALAATCVAGIAATWASGAIIPHALPAWWRLGCIAGAGDACLAASRSSPEIERAKLQDLACERGVTSACLLVAARQPNERARLCEREETRCRTHPYVYSAPHCGHELDDLCERGTKAKSREVTP